jgi:hypothetical protein
MPRPALSSELRLRICKMYLQGGALNAMGKELHCAPTTIRAVLVANNITIRPKHVVLNNHMKGKDNSGENNAMWKGGKLKCSVCGKESSYWRKKDTKCADCYHESQKGEGNTQWKPLEQCKTDESKIWRKRVEYRKWRKEVFTKDSYLCQICGKNTRDLHPHHLNSFDKFVEQRFDVNNGVTLCTKHHKQFHKEHGYGKNTTEQYVIFNQQFNNKTGNNNGNSN